MQRFLQFHQSVQGGTGILGSVPVPRMILKPPFIGASGSLAVHFSYITDFGGYVLNHTLIIASVLLGFPMACAPSWE